MKKLLGIVVLGLLWFLPNANSDTCLAGCGAKEAKKFPWKAQYVATKSPDKMQPFCVTCYFVGGGNTLEEAKERALYLCQNSKQYKKKGKKCYYDIRVHAAINPDMVMMQKEAEQKKQTKLKNKMSLEADIKKFKEMCTTIGYSSGTEKFADCVKDLYLRKVDNQNLAQSQMSSTEKKRTIDPSVWDDLGNISESLLGGSSVSESLGGVSSSSGSRKITCFKTGEETGGLNKICRYDCVGNLVTTTVGAAQMCPIQIQR